MRDMGRRSAHGAHFSRAHSFCAPFWQCVARTLAFAAFFTAMYVSLRYFPLRGVLNAFVDYLMSGHKRVEATATSLGAKPPPAISPAAGVGTAHGTASGSFQHPARRLEFA